MNVIVTLMNDLLLMHAVPEFDEHLTVSSFSFVGAIESKKLLWDMSNRRCSRLQPVGGQMFKYLLNMVWRWWRNCYCQRFIRKLKRWVRRMWRIWKRIWICLKYTYVRRCFHISKFIALNWNDSLPRSEPKHLFGIKMNKCWKFRNVTLTLVIGAHDYFISN